MTRAVVFHEVGGPEVLRIDVTSVQQIPQEMARLAVDRILARYAGSPVPDREIVLQPELKVRGTTGLAPH